MSTPFLAEMRIFSFNFAPKGWATCDGQLLPISQNQALFSLLGTTYGGNGQTNFGLPNLKGRVPMHTGVGLIQGQTGGEEAHTLALNEMPQHTHMQIGNAADGDSANPTGRLLGNQPNTYGPASNPTTLAPATVSNIGGSQPHDNMSPYLVLNIGIALQGIFPSQF